LGNIYISHLPELVWRVRVSIKPDYSNLFSYVCTPVLWNKKLTTNVNLLCDFDKFYKVNIPIKEVFMNFSLHDNRGYNAKYMSKKNCQFAFMCLL